MLVWELTLVNIWTERRGMEGRFPDQSTRKALLYQRWPNIVLYLSYPPLFFVTMALITKAQRSKRADTRLIFVG